jgi:arginine/serine-rich splicing factor 4/5/6
MATGDEGQVHSASGGGGGDGGGNLYLRPIFMGNLSHGCVASDVENMFQNPVSTGGAMDGEVNSPFPVDRVDMKRGYCFVFLKDPESRAEKERAENFVQEMNGMYVQHHCPGHHHLYCSGIAVLA